MRKWMIRWMIDFYLVWGLFIPNFLTMLWGTILK